MLLSAVTVILYIVLSIITTGAIAYMMHTIFGKFIPIFLPALFMLFVGSDYMYPIVERPDLNGLIYAGITLVFVYLIKHLTHLFWAFCTMMFAIVMQMLFQARHNILFFGAFVILFVGIIPGIVSYQYTKREEREFQNTFALPVNILVDVLGAPFWLIAAYATEIFYFRAKQEEGIWSFMVKHPFRGIFARFSDKFGETEWLFSFDIPYIFVPFLAMLIMVLLTVLLDVSWHMKLKKQLILPQT